MTTRAIATAPGRATEHVDLTGAQEAAHAQAAADWASGGVNRAKARAAGELASTDVALGGFLDELVSLLVAKGVIVDADLSPGFRALIAARAALRSQT